MHAIFIVYIYNKKKAKCIINRVILHFSHLLDYKYERGSMYK